MENIRTINKIPRKLYTRLSPRILLYIILRYTYGYRDGSGIQPHRRRTGVKTEKQVAKGKEEKKREKYDRENHRNIHVVVVVGRPREEQRALTGGGAFYEFLFSANAVAITCSQLNLLVDD